MILIRKNNDGPSVSLKMPNALPGCMQNVAAKSMQVRTVPQPAPLVLGLHQEMEILVDSGLSPLQALQSATIISAEVMHMEESIGNS